MARNRCDGLSDRDILVVGSSEISKWRDDGWSVAEFSEDQILSMASSGSLFIQHLKQEGIIVRDDTNFLAKVLCEFTPAVNYNHELNEGCGLLRKARSATSSYWAWLCSCDMAFVAIRNIGIHQLAAKGMCVFDFNDIVDCLGQARKISAIKMRALKRLRFLKYAYRNRLFHVARDDTLECALDGAEELFGVQISGVVATDVVEAGYNGLRCLELSLVERFDPRFLDALVPTDTLSSAWAAITDPRGYPKPWKNDPKWVDTVAAAVAVRCSSSSN